MSRNNLFIGIAAVLCLTGGASLAQAPQRGGRGGGAPDNTVMAPRELKPGLFLLTGAGANTLVRVTTEGLIVVDTKNPGDEQANSLLAQIKTLSPLPVKFVINTQHHPDHVGNNQKFIDAGATVLSLEALKTFMGTDPRTTQIPGRPTQTFAKDYSLKLVSGDGTLHDLKIEKRDDQTVTVKILASLLSRGQYAIQISRLNPDGTYTRIPGNYYFNIE